MLWTPKHNIKPSTIVCLSRYSMRHATYGVHHRVCAHKKKYMQYIVWWSEGVHIDPEIYTMGEHVHGGVEGTHTVLHGNGVVLNPPPPGYGMVSAF